MAKRRPGLQRLAVYNADAELFFSHLDSPQDSPLCCSAAGGRIGAEQGQDEVQHCGNPTTIPSRDL